MHTHASLKLVAHVTSETWYCTQIHTNAKSAVIDRVGNLWSAVKEQSYIFVHTQFSLDLLYTNECEGAYDPGWSNNSEQSRQCRVSTD